MIKKVGATCIFAIAVTANAQTNPATPADCLFNWAETNYPNLFAPAGATSATLGPYYYRYYSQTNAYLGTSSTDLSVEYLGAGSSAVENVGALSGWLNNVECVNAASAAGSWTFDAAIFSTYRGDFGGVRTALADVTVLPLRDGRYRMFTASFPVSPTTPTGINSAISNDGVTFTLESGPRIVLPYRTSPTTTVMLGHCHVVRLEDGRVRIFLRGGNSPDPQPITGGIYSFTSSDEGVTFTPDPGLRIDYAVLGVRLTTGPSVVKMKTGGWRMYFSEENPNTTDPVTGVIRLGVNRVFSAFSMDLLTWTIDPGVRAGPGSAIANAGSATHPASISNDDGSVTLVYSSNRTRGFFASTSLDGLNFTREVATPFSSTTAGFYTWSTIGPGNDAFLLRLNTGEVRIYYNWGRT